MSIFLLLYSIQSLARNGICFIISLFFPQAVPFLCKKKKKFSFLNNLASSAKRLMQLLSYSGKSLTYIKNISGAKTEPFSTPLVIFLHSNCVSLKTVLISLPLRQSSIQFQIFPFIPPMFSNFHSNLLCGILSNAFFRSTYIQFAHPSLSCVTSITLEYKLNRFVAHDFPSLNPNCLSVILFFFLSTQSIAFFMISHTLQIMLVSDTGL